MANVKKDAEWLKVLKKSNAEWLKMLKCRVAKSIKKKVHTLLKLRELQSVSFVEVD